MVVLLQPRELLLYVLTEAIRNLTMTSADHDVHATDLLEKRHDPEPWASGSWMESASMY